MEKFCQSCGMPLKGNQGKNLDGSLSTEFCYYCWEKGEFTHPDIKTSKEMQQFIYELFKNKYKMSSLKAWFFTLMIPGLKRWKI